ncbi:hypothetical protein BJY01DRAFT_251380 [Aspergillus pseudoustus]|uniref:Glycoside hydrolase superfamily n=1 Tax=Aspergillus pseudoustus TaxID=1810923 RepID=A0ABR4JBW8_9EURO
MIPNAHAAYIDPNLVPSTPSLSPVSSVDTTLSNYDRLVLKIGDEPFFYNGIQLRADKLRDVWRYSGSDIKPLYQQVAEDGFTVVNTQILWSDVQPDVFVNASESTYIRGGSYANHNFASSASSLIGYKRGDESNKELTYVKFDFSDYQDNIDGAKVRFYMDSTPLDSTPFTAKLYGITNNSWSASSITWTHAPNHNGVDIAGTNGVDYFLTSASPSYDLVTSKSFYDFDVTDFVQNHCPDMIASFILQAANNGTNVTIGTSLSGAKGEIPPQLILSDQDRFDWTYVDTLIEWTEDADLKLEFVWFGSDSTGVTMDSRVPYFAFLNTKIEELNADGSHSVIFSKNSDPAYGIYWYYLDKNDLTTRAQEKRAITEMMNHVATYNAAHGNKRTVIGVDVANEPSVQRFHQVGFTAWHNPKTWAALSNFSSVQAFVDRTMWEYCVNLANAVKESNYPVWTRSNDVRGVDAAHSSYNEAQRATVGTSLDFVGIDPYSDSFTSAYRFGHTASYDGKNFAIGKNVPMIMENSGSYDTSHGVILATLAGGGFYNVYDFMSSDNLGLYVPKDSSAKDYRPVARGSYVQTVRNTNNLLKKISRDLASKAPKGAGGESLDYLNVFWNETIVQSSLGNIDITYEPSSYTVVGIVISKGERETVLASTGSAEYTLSGITDYGIASVESGYYSDLT